MRKVLARPDRNAYLLAGKGRKPLTNDQIYLLLRQLVKDHGIHRPRRIAGNKIFGAPIPHSLRHNRHSCAVCVLSDGYSLADILNRLGHEDLQSTMVYLRMDLIQKRRIHKKFIEYTKSSLVQDPKIEQLIGWENKEDILAWLDSL